MLRRKRMNMWISVFEVRPICRKRYKTKHDTGLLCYTSLVQDGRQSSWVNGTGYLDISCILNQSMTEQNTIQLTKVEIILIKL